MTTPSISVIMPTYNGENYLEETLRSIAAQSKTINELICSDDGSTDNTLEIVKDFSNEVEFKVRCISHQPSGVTANYLNALCEASGDFIFVADQDDVWLPNKVEKMVEMLEQVNVVMVAHDSFITDDLLNKSRKTLRGTKSRSSKITRLVNRADDLENLHAFLRGGIPLQAHTLAFKCELVPLLLDKPKTVDDWWFEEWASCMALTIGRINLIEDAVVLYRQHDSQTSGGIHYNNATRTKLVESQGKYHSKIQKMLYCHQVASRKPDTLMRARVFESYRLFLQDRQRIIIGKAGIFGSILSISSNLWNFRYRRYGNGVKSAILDFFTLLLR